MDTAANDRPAGDETKERETANDGDRQYYYWNKNKNKSMISTTARKDMRVCDDKYMYIMYFMYRELNNLLR